VAGSEDENDDEDENEVPDEHDAPHGAIVCGSVYEKQGLTKKDDADHADDQAYPPERESLD
jgi:hypothetical protein